MNQEVFKVVRGTEASILSTIPLKGYVYFATDTKKIFYSDGTSFLPMGGNAGVWYAKMEYAETPEEGQVEFDFVPDDIEGNEDVTDGRYNLPNIDDLIFNTPDGCFYRVMEIDKTSSPVLHCNRLTVAGGGGGSQGGGGGANAGYMTIARIGDQILNTLQGNSCFIEYQYTAKDASGQETGAGTASLYINGLLKNTYIANQGRNQINVGPYLEVGTNNIRLVVSGNIGGLSNITQAKNWTVVSTNLSLTWDYDETTINTGEEFIFNWTVSISLPHTTLIMIDDRYPIQVPSTDTSRTKNYTIQREAYGLTHGAHKVSMRAVITINNTTFYSAEVIHNVICVDSNRSDVIISVNLAQTEVNQYDTLAIPVVFYDPSSTNNKVSAVLRENGEDRDNWVDYDNAVQYYWNYTPTTAGNKILSILSGTTEKTIYVTVNDLGLTTTEVPGYDFKFKASEIISNNNLQNWSYGDIVPSFSEDFDWVNGGIKTELDENNVIRNYVSIKAGTRLSFNYMPFYNDKKRSGFCFKIIFKANQCRTYDANILNIGSAADDTVYLQLTANGGTFKPNGNDAITVPYCEDSYIELEFDVQPLVNRREAYILTWIDGVPAGVAVYEENTTFIQNIPRNIVIGSDDCDVQLYMLKVYQKHLTDEEHLINFIMDASNANEIVARYNRNNIVGDNGHISYQKLIEKNPNCDVYLYEIPKMTITKKDLVDGCSYKRYKGSLSPLQTAENVTMSVQGTSSAAYGLAAFNFNSTFNEGFTDYTVNPEGEHIDDWAMDENAIPIHDYNTKVNVASCEGVNNALNQEWYDRMVNHVFKTEYKAKNPKSRHTMQFMNMGVVFIKDHNPTTNSTGGVEDNLFKDTQGYINDPFYKMYSICNMGNIKRNTGVFSDPYNPYDVIMENPDNQSVYQQMTGVVDQETGGLYGQWDKKGEKFYPKLTTSTYEKTEDSKAVEGTVYYARVEQNGEVSYVVVENVVPGVTEVDKYYELKEAGELSSTEVFEWRARPLRSKTDKETDVYAWDYMQEHNIKPATFNGKPNDKSMSDLANQAWEQLVAWFATNNPEAATNEALPEPETYGGYVFKGYKSIADRIDQYGDPMPAYTQENSILKGTSITRYAGTYTHDTRERRIAKMLNECEDHLIMDEIVFHYLFIQRHALVDNVAKNTFWHTEDLQHWSMIKDYDNDTSDGNDNSGHLTLTYGYEVLDHVGHDESKSFVFNASNSVWLHFIDELIEARQVMYQYLDKSSIAAWDAEPYLNLFNQWQSCVPERVWIEDYYRKYLRPKEVYGATQFLAMLEGGKKTHQRKQFETYQDAYMSSEYFGRKCQASQIDIRANGTAINTMSFPIKMYADCYIRVAAGSGHEPNVNIRYHRGDTALVRFPSNITDANDMTTYFYQADYITSLENIEMLKPKKVDISAAKRLREFSMKRVEGASYYQLTEDTELDVNKSYYEALYFEVQNPVASELYIYYELDNGEYTLTHDEEIAPGKTYFVFEGYRLVTNPVAQDLPFYYEVTVSDKNLNLEEVSFNTNTMLEKLEVLDCPNAENALNLSNSTNLKYLDIRGSGFSGITLASNAPVHTLYLNDPQTLSFKNLTKVQNFIIGYNNLNSLLLDNIDSSPSLSSKTLVDNQHNGFLTYNLQNVQWTINNSNEITDDSIAILDKLLEEGNMPYGNGDRLDKALAVSGTLTITGDAYSGSHSLDLYNKYAIESETNFPELDLIFEAPAARLYTISILDGDDEVVWLKKTRGGSLTINAAFLEDGPKGAFNLEKTITKKSTAANVFIFSGVWEVLNATTGNMITTIDCSALSDKSPNGTISVSDNIMIRPIFNTEVKQYTITFMNDEELISSDNYDYGTKISTILPVEMPRKNDDDLGIYETYNFKGYALSPLAVNALVFTDSFTVEADMTYYAIFGAATDVHDHSNVHEEYFTFEQTVYNDRGDSSFDVAQGQGYLAKVKTGVQISGKLTIPATYNNLPIVRLSGFQGQTGLTGVFFETGTQIRSIENLTFKNVTTLKYFEIPDSLRQIGNEAFFNTSLRLLLPGQSKNETTYYLGSSTSNLYSIGKHAFNNSIDAQCERLIISSSITETAKDAPVFCFFNNATNLKEVIYGSLTQGSRLNYSNAQYPFELNYGFTNLLNKITFYMPPGASYDPTTLVEWLNPYAHNSDAQPHAAEITVEIVPSNH